MVSLKCGLVLFKNMKEYTEYTVIHKINELKYVSLEPSQCAEAQDRFMLFII